MTGSDDGGHRAVRAAAAVAAGLGGLAVLRFVLPAATPRIRARGKPGPGGVAALEKIRIGGSDQWVLERSEDTGNPVVLFLHGGPGTSQLTSNRRDTRGLEKYFTVVNWDQRGAGKSYAAIGDPDRMNIGQLVADTRELTVHLLKKFHQDRLVLVGHSWGTVVGALAVSRYPDSTRAMSASARSARWLKARQRLIGGPWIRPGNTTSGELSMPWSRWGRPRMRVTGRRRPSRSEATWRGLAARSTGAGSVHPAGWWGACCSHVSTRWLTGSTWSGGFSARCGCCGRSCSNSTCSRACRK